MKNFITHVLQIQFLQFQLLIFMVTCQSSELGWEVTVKLPANFLSLRRGSVNAILTDMEKKMSVVEWQDISY